MSAARDVIAREAAASLGRQDDGDPFVLCADFCLPWLDQGEVDFHRLAADVIAALSDAGYRIVGPGALDRETLEKAAVTAENWQTTGGFYDDTQKDEITAAIRLLGGKDA